MSPLLSPQGEFDPATLVAVVGAAVGGPVDQLGEIRCESSYRPFNTATGGLQRLTGTARIGEVRTAWSVIVKTVQTSDGPVGGASDPWHPHYWAREALLYEARVLEQLPAIRAPRCFGVDRRASAAQIWLEDIPRDDARWSLADYERAGRALGAFNGAYLAGLPLPTSEALSHDWLRGVHRSITPTVDRLRALGEHPMVRRCWPGSLLDRYLQLWRQRSELAARLDTLPHTFCHLDAFPRNLLGEPGDAPVAVDWSYAGIAPVGAELAALVVAGACLGDTHPGQLDGIEQASMSGYLDGLALAGWRGDPAMVRFGYAATAALRYGLFPIGVYLAGDSLRLHFESAMSRPADGIADRWAAIAAFLYQCIDRVLGTF